MMMMMMHKSPCRWRNSAGRGTCARHERVKGGKMIADLFTARCINACFLPSLTGAPVAVGMNIDIASIDMVSEVNMVGESYCWLWLIALLWCWHGSERHITSGAAILVTGRSVCACTSVRVSRVCMRVMHKEEKRI